MQPIKNFEAKKENSNQALPAGGYVARVIGAEVRNSGHGDRLVIAFEIAEGEYKDFFKKKFDADTRKDKKWKGVYRLSVPQEGHQYYKNQKRDFENFIWAIEESNPGYTWEWNEATLKGKFIGVLFRDKEYDFENENGNRVSGWTTECCRTTDIQSIRGGDFKIPKAKALNKPAESISPALDLSDFEDILSSDGTPF